MYCSGDDATVIVFSQYLLRQHTVQYLSLSFCVIVKPCRSPSAKTQHHHVYQSPHSFH